MTVVFGNFVSIYTGHSDIYVGAIKLFIKFVDSAVHAYNYYVVHSEGILLVNKEVKQALEGDCLVLPCSNMSFKPYCTYAHTYIKSA